MESSTSHDNILSVAQQIFSMPPKEPFQIQLQLEGGPENADVPRDQFIFQALTMILCEGMKVLYGDEEGKIDLPALSPQDWGKVKQYLNSFGYDALLFVYPRGHQYPKNAPSDRLYLNLNPVNSDQTYSICFEPLTPVSRCNV